MKHFILLITSILLFAGTSSAAEVVYTKSLGDRVDGIISVHKEGITCIPEMECPETDLGIYYITLGITDGGCARTTGFYYDAKLTETNQLLIKYAVETTKSSWKKESGETDIMYCTTEARPMEITFKVDGLKGVNLLPKDVVLQNKIKNDAVIRSSIR